MLVCTAAPDGPVGPAGPVVPPGPVVLLPGPVLVPGPLPPLEPPFVVPLPGPVATALPFLTTQFRGAPSFWQREGYGAFRSRVSFPLVNVGLLQLDSVSVPGA